LNALADEIPDEERKRQAGILCTSSPQEVVTRLKGHARAGLVAESSRRRQFLLADEVEELRRVHDLAMRMSWLDLNAVVRDLLKSVAAVHRTEMGLLSLRVSDRNELLPAASPGFSDDFLEQIARVPEGTGACGTCFRNRERLLIADTETDEIFAPYRDAARLAGFRSVHSTPLLDRSNQLIGVLSVHSKSLMNPASVSDDSRIFPCLRMQRAGLHSCVQQHNRLSRHHHEQRCELCRASSVDGIAISRQKRPVCAVRMRGILLGTTSGKITKTGENA
jgi:hypothetical protein